MYLPYLPPNSLNAKTGINSVQPLLTTDLNRNVKTWAMAELGQFSLNKCTQSIRTKLNIKFRLYWLDSYKLMTFYLTGNKEGLETSFLTGRSFFKTTIHEKVGCYIPITFLRLLFIKGKKCSSFNTWKSNTFMNVH